MTRSWLEQRSLRTSDCIRGRGWGQPLVTEFSDPTRLRPPLLKGDPGFEVWKGWGPSDSNLWRKWWWLTTAGVKGCFEDASFGMFWGMFSGKKWIRMSQGCQVGKWIRKWEKSPTFLSFIARKKDVDHVWQRKTDGMFHCQAFSLKMLESWNLRHNSTGVLIVLSHVNAILVCPRHDPFICTARSGTHVIVLLVLR
jgi:hypothetical protein